MRTATDGGAGQESRRRRATGRRTLIRVAVPGAAVALGAALLMGGGQGSALAVNVVDNPTFDAGVQGWKVNPGADLRLVAGRHGNGVRMTQPGPGNRTIALNDAVNTVASTVPRTSYDVGAWVRTTRPNAYVALRVMEVAPGALRGQGLTPLTLKDTAWHKLTLRYTAVGRGSALDLNVVANALPAGVGVDVDDVTLSLAAPTSPSPSTRTSTTSSTTSSNSTTVSTSPSAGPSTTSGTTGATTSSTAPTTSTSPTTSPTTSATGPTASPTETASAWKLVWDDEFDGIALDTGNWKAENLSTYGDGNQELACLMNRPQNITVHDGVLSLTARREATPITCGTHDTRFPDGRDYTSAHLSTKGLHEWTYGKFEMRARLPTQATTSKGMWPAFWMRPTSGGTGEIDIMEAIGSDATGVDYDRVHQTIWRDYTGTPKQATLVPLAGNARPSDGMHTYAVEWTPTSITWLVDGAVTYERTPQTTAWFADTFTKPFYLRLNLAVGGTWAGSPTDATSLPASYDVDYVRVYQH